MKQLRRRVLAAAGATLVAPRTWAQQRGKRYRLGLLTSLLPVPGAIMDALSAGLSKRGWTLGTNLVVEVRAVPDGWAQAGGVANELVALNPDVILALSTGAALAMHGATRSLPIVTWCGYPIQAGLTTSLARPSGNVTGVANYASTEVWGKFLQILGELRPGLREVVVLWDYLPPGFPDGLEPLAEIKSAAERSGINLHLWTVRDGKEQIEPFAAIERRRFDAILVTCCGGVNNQPASLKRIAELVAQRRLPAITDLATAMFAGTGFVLAYSPHVPTVVDRLAYFIDRVLRGAKPGELPFEQPAKFDLVINLKAAKALGIEVPQSLRLRADRVIE